MLDTVPTAEELTALVGQSLYDVWIKLCALIDGNYDMDRLWNQGGKAWKYEYKYRRGCKTLCALYARENCIGFRICRIIQKKVQKSGNGGLDCKYWQEHGWLGKSRPWKS